MSNARHKSLSISEDHAFLAGKKRRPAPHEFVLDAIASLSPYTHPMFGCLGVYVKDKIVFVLRDKATSIPDNGVWLAYSRNSSTCGLFGSWGSLSQAGRSFPRMLRTLSRRHCARANSFWLEIPGSARCRKGGGQEQDQRQVADLLSSD